MMIDANNQEFKVCPLKVLYDDEHLYAIHKPAGIGFHNTDEAPGIVQLVKQHFKEDKLFPIHRLDKMTSGLMVFARNSQVNSDLSCQLADKQIEKYYLALSSRKPNKKQGLITGDMQKGRRGSYLLTREKTNPAITRFFAKPFLDKKSNKRWIFVLKPETGKTHQLRVAMKSIGSAALGDQRYGQDSADRGYLHAYHMRFELYGTLYDLFDECFEGQEFDLSNNVDMERLGEFAKPEDLSWSKKAFKVSKSAP